MPAAKATPIQPHPMNDDAILQRQRSLRRQLFEGSGAIRWRPGRELAAQLLLYLDDPRACWQLTADWLRDTLDADRVDGGFGGYVDSSGAVHDYIVVSEAQRSSLPLPSVMGWRFDATDPGLSAVWSDAAPALTLIRDVSQERAMSERLRGALRGVSTAAKLALPVRNAQQPLGLICADWHRSAPRWNAEVCNQLGSFADEALGPVLAAANQAMLPMDEAPDAERPLGPSTTDALVGRADSTAALQAAMAQLTPAERRVAQLVANGLSYKEVARQLGRSLSTVDHQLRSIRDKLGVRSTARLVHLLGQALRGR